MWTRHTKLILSKLLRIWDIRVNCVDIAHIEVEKILRGLERDTENKSANDVLGQVNLLLHSLI